MSTVTMLKDHSGRKAGSTVSVPFIVGKDLVARGLAQYPAKPAAPPKPATAPPADHAAELQRVKGEAVAAMKEMAAERAAELKLADAEIAALRADLEAAQKQLAAVTAERDELAKKAKK